MAGEHKQVTCVFVDIVGSLTLAEQLGSEAWGELLDRFFEIAAEAVQALGGTIHQFTGDGVMAIFGAPVAMEDHARRACLSAVRLHESLAAADPRLSLRIGVHSGETVIDRARGGSVGDLPVVTVVGGTVGIARRLESMAPHGGTMLSAQTAALVAGEFRLLDHGPAEVRGLPYPIGLVELIGVAAPRDQLAVLTARGALSALVGRAPELGRLHEILTRVRRKTPAFVVVVADPGIGKTRLIHEFVSAARDVQVTWARATPQGRHTPYLLLLDLLRGLLDLSVQDDPLTARVSAALRSIDPALEGEVVLLQGFLGTEESAAQLDPEVRERRLLAVVARIVRARAQRRPQLLVIDDLQWADEASTRFIEDLKALMNGTAVLLLATARTGWQGLATTVIALRPLTAADVDELAVELLGHDPGVAAIATDVATRAAGNPYFCEELVRGLVAAGHLAGGRGARRLAGSATPTLPPSIQASLAERLDRLTRLEQTLLSYLAVVGRETTREFIAAAVEIGEPVDPVAAVDNAAAVDIGEPVDNAAAVDPAAPIEAALLALGRAGLIVEQVSRAGDPSTFTVAHPLIAEVAEATLLSESRRAIHARVADTMEKVWGGLLEPRAALLAQHRAAAGQDRQAADWYVRAATWSGFTSPRESLRLWQSAREMADRLPDAGELSVICRLAILGAAWRVEISADAVTQVHSEVIERLAGRPDDDLMRVLADFAFSVTLHFRRRVAEGLALARVNFARVERLGDPALLVLLAGAYWYGALSVGAFTEARDVSDRALALAAGDTSLGRGFPGVPDHPYALCLFGRGYAAGFLGCLPLARRDLTEAITLTQTEGLGEVEPAVRSGLAFLTAMTGEARESLSHAEAALDAAERTGNSLALTAAHLAHIWAGWSGSDWPRVEWAAGRVLSLATHQGVGLELVTFAHGGLAEVALAAGDLDRALLEAGRSLDTSLRPSPLWGELVAQVRLAKVLRAKVLRAKVLRAGAPSPAEAPAPATEAPGPAAAAEAALARAWQLRDCTGIRICDPLLHRESAAAATWRGDEPAAAWHTAAAVRSIHHLQRGTPDQLCAAPVDTPRGECPSR